MTHRIQSFSELSEEQMPFAGGKGGTLARLYQAGYPVPDGFVILPSAFNGDDLPPEIWKQVRAKLERIFKHANGCASLAIRSSALSEDSSQASFAGEFETVIGVRNEDEIRSAIQTVRRSRFSERVQAYSQIKGLEVEHEMAVVIQRLIHAEISGVLFSADPITGDQMSMIGNFTYGSGERLVSGKTSGEAFTFSRPEGQYTGPPELKRHARQLYKLASRLERELGCPQDIEWSIAAGKLYLLQARPITTLQGHNLATGEWNDSLRGNFLWSNVNYGEAVPDVMTPLAWSIIRQGALGEWIDFQGHLSFGNIGGRMYFNISVLASIFHLLGKSDTQLLDTIEATLHTNLPVGTTIPIIPASKLALLSIVPKLIKIQWQERQIVKRLPKLISNIPGWCNQIQRWILDSLVGEELVFLWNTEIKAQTKKLWLGMLHSANQYVRYTNSLRHELSQYAGLDDADALISGVSNEAELLASLGPVVGISRIVSGEMSRHVFLESYGHRGEQEFELSIPRLAEKPEWLDRQLDKFEETSVDVDALLVTQRTEFETAWQRFCQRHPRKVNVIRNRIDQVSRRSRLREATRSELARVLWVLRKWVLRASEITQLGEDIFFLTIDELLAYLIGDKRLEKLIPARKETYYRYKSLPAYPAVIRGRFDPFEWAGDPNRRTDIFDEHLTAHSRDIEAVKLGKIVGAAGSAGRAKGTVRLLRNLEEGDQFQPGEVLVAAQTNIGWTPLFPRAAAIITDVGAPLSHAAVVARELGIPAVVGCGDATMRLKTGDRVQVDGSQGIIEILEKV